MPIHIPHIRLCESICPLKQGKSVCTTRGASLIAIINTECSAHSSNCEARLRAFDEKFPTSEICEVKGMSLPLHVLQCPHLLR